MFKNTICCAICGLTKLNHKHKHFKKLYKMYNNLNINEFKCTFYDIVHCLLFKYTITSNGKDIYIMLYWMWPTYHQFI